MSVLSITRKETLKAVQISILQTQKQPDLKFSYRKQSPLSENEFISSFPSLLRNS